MGIALIVEGVRITTMHTQPLDADSVSELQIDCTMPPDVLLPNVYGVDVGAHDHATGRGLDWITGASTFEVLQVAVAGAVADEKELGVVRIEPEWRWRVNSSR